MEVIIYIAGAVSQLALGAGAWRLANQLRDRVEDHEDRITDLEDGDVDDEDEDGYYESVQLIGFHAPDTEDDDEDDEEDE